MSAKQFASIFMGYGDPKAPDTSFTYTEPSDTMGDVRGRLTMTVGALQEKAIDLSQYMATCNMIAIQELGGYPLYCGSASGSTNQDRIAANKCKVWFPGLNPAPIIYVTGGGKGIQQNSFDLFFMGSTI